MKLPKSSGRPKRPKLLIVRRVTGNSMKPSLLTGQLVYATNLYTALRNGDVVIIWHQGLEKIKRIKEIDGKRLYLVGDNQAASTDSRTFGWLDREAVRAKVVWPRVSGSDR